MRYIALTLGLLGGPLLSAHADSTLMQQQQQMIQQQQQQFQQQRNSAAQQSLRNTQTQISATRKHSRFSS